MRIRARLVYLLIFLAIIFLGMFMLQKRYERQKFFHLWESVQLERENVFDKILTLKQKSLQT
ncbi:MAG: hypothetical protein NT014_05530, partial [Candidatus Omnitrophica bacterium]|nr:hypothetical protein [Candidatus Omnitrophota bacterium]